VDATHDIDKTAVLEALRARIEQRLKQLTDAQRDAQAGATHSEAKSEHDKDTRATEGSYLARGLAERVEVLHDAVALLRAMTAGRFGPSDAIGLTALVGMRDEDDVESVYFVVPTGGGERLTVDGTDVLALTPQSPLGEAVVGRRVGDEIELVVRGRKRSSLITWIA
jgi:transcription elongation GreA/GreB family factor